MNVELLNSRYGAPGRIVFRVGFAGYPEVVLANRYGTAEVALLGANVLSYRPTGHSPVLFRPAKRDYNRGEAFHGGIPVCWPQFGNRFDKTLPQHGFARLMVFEVRGTEYTEEKTEIKLGLKSDAETLKLWPHEFDLEITVSVTMKLNLSMVTKNTGSSPFAFNCGFHPYFVLKDRNLACVKGLDGLTFIDGWTPELVEGVQQGDLKLDFAPDHIFRLPEAPKHETAVIDPGLKRAIAMVASGNTKMVVWNVGEGKTMPDFDADDWRRYVCVEPVSEWPGGSTLQPGGSHELLMAIQATMEGDFEKDR